MIGMRHAQIKIYMLENTKQMFFLLKVAGRIHIFIWCIIHFLSLTHTHAYDSIRSLCLCNTCYPYSTVIEERSKMLIYYSEETENEVF